jgi:ABC-type branched-subunit amino acid transport system substrate-binding protein
MKGEYTVTRKGSARIYLTVLAAVALLGTACASRHPQAGITSAAAGPVAAGAASATPGPTSASADTGSGSSGSAAIPTPAASDAGGAAASPVPSAGSSPKAAGALAGSAAGATGTGSASGRTQTAAAAPRTAGGSASAGSGSAEASAGSGAPAAGAAPGGKAKGADSITVPGPSSQGVTDSTIKVGILAPLSGYAGFLGELEVDSVKAYLSDVNARGGVGGRKYQIVSADSRFEPAQATVGARRLVEEEKVFALYDFLANSIGPYVTAKGIPTFAFGVEPYAWTSKWPNVYPTGLNVVDAILHEAYVTTQIEHKPIKSVAILTENSNMPWAEFVDYAKAAWTQFGVEVKSVDRFNLSDGDCTQIVIKMRNLNIDYWAVGQTLGWPLCGQAMARQGWFPPQGFGGPYTDDANYVNQMGQAADGVYAITNGPQIYVKDATGKPDKGTPYSQNGGVATEVDHFLATMQKYSPRSSNPAAIESIWAQNYWSLAKLLNEAIQRQNGAVTWKGVNQWIQSQDNFESGLVAPQSFIPKCKVGSKGLYLYHYKWNASANSLEEQDWKPLGGYPKIPTAVKDKIVPGAGDCWESAMADAKVQ